jgi:hypothetical protein
MEFSAPAPLTRSLLVRLPHAPLVASASGATILLHALPAQVELGSHRLPEPALHLTSTPQAPHKIAAASSTTITLFDASSAGGLAPVATIRTPANPLAAIALSQTTLLVFHAHALGVSLYPISASSLSAATTFRLPAFIPFFATQVATVSTSSEHTLPQTACLSPCGRYAALALKLPTQPAVRVVSLHEKRGRSPCAVVAEAVGAANLGGHITDICGVRWLPGPVNALLVWGRPQDGKEAICLLGVDGDLLHAGLPVDPAAEDEICAGYDDNGIASGDEDIAYYYRDLGIKTVSVARQGLVAIGGFDGNIRLINAFSWTHVAAWTLDTPCVDPLHPPAVYLERQRLIPREAAGRLTGHKSDENIPASDPNVIRQSSKISTEGATKSGEAKPSRSIRAGGANRGAICRASYFEVVDGYGRVVVKASKGGSGTGASAVNELLRCGIGLLSFSADGKWLSARSDRSSNVVFIADIVHVRLASALVLCDDARGLSWSTQEPAATDDEGNPVAEGNGGNLGNERASRSARLAVVSGGESIYFWSELGVAAVRVPETLVSSDDSHGHDEQGPRENRPLGFGAAAPKRGGEAERGRFLARKFMWTPGDATALVADTLSSRSWCLMYMD